MSTRTHQGPAAGKKIPADGEQADLRLVLLVTYRCNLGCRYCFVPKDEQYMPLEYLRRAVDFILTSEKQGLQIQFFGAEPLLMPFGHYRKMIAYAERRMKETGKKVDFILTTNGVLLNDERIKFFRRHGFTIELSIDGSPLSQNLNRPQTSGADSYGLLVRNLPRIFKSGIAARVSMVISPQTSKYLSGNFIHLVKLGFHRIFMMVACGMEWPKASLDSLREELKSIEPVCAHLINTGKITFHNIEDWLAPFRMNTELSVDLDGNLYSACHCYLIHNKRTRKKYSLGKLDGPLENIDTVSERRFSNETAIKILYRDEKILKGLESNRQAGNIMAEFVGRLKKNLKRYKFTEKEFSSRLLELERAARAAAAGAPAQAEDIKGCSCVPRQVKPYPAAARHSSKPRY
jgi:sulfatase maturation enzyme AslB (radical SAM superfamily)